MGGYLTPSERGFQTNCDEGLASGTADGSSGRGIGRRRTSEWSKLKVADMTFVTIEVSRFDSARMAMWTARKSLIPAVVRQVKEADIAKD